MYKELKKTETETNKVKVGFIENHMVGLQKDIENAFKDDVEQLKC